MEDWLKQVHGDPGTERVEHNTTWLLRELKDNLATKPRETFWVQAACRGSGPDEHFQYMKAQHTRAPMVRGFPALLKVRVGTVNYRPNLQGDLTRDHGFLSKIHPGNMEALFSSSEVNVLS